jgi:hypothetical protein
MKYYTYKITFKDLPGYFYYGKRKDNGKLYLGSPKTWKHLWVQFEPEVQVLQWYSTEKEVKAAEESVIKATWRDKYSLNENVGGLISEEVCKKNGGKTGSENIKAAHAALTPEILSENGKKNGPANGRRTGPENLKAARAALTPEALSEGGKKGGKKSGKKNGAVNGKKSSKVVLLTNIATGQTFEFPSAREACRVLGLEQGKLCSVARGSRKQHKGYTAVYV